MKKQKYKLIIAAIVLITALIGVFSAASSMSQKNRIAVSGDGNQIVDVNSGDVTINNQYMPPPQREGPAVQLYASEINDLYNEESPMTRPITDDTAKTVSAVFPYQDSSLAESFADGCRIDFTILNKSSDDLVLDSFTFSALEVVPDYAPKITFSHDPNEDQRTYTITARNNGWGDATNITAVLTSDNPLLPFIFSPEQLSGSVALLRPGEEKTIISLDIGDRVINDETGEHLNLSDMRAEDIPQEQLHLFEHTFEVSYALDQDAQAQPYFLDYVVITNLGFQFLGRGGVGEPKLYGILVPVEEGSASLTARISQIIPAHGSAQLPFFFFVDQSAKLKFKMEFGFTGQDPIQSEVFEADFAVDYPQEGVDGPCYDGKDFVALDDEDQTLFFPFSLMNDYVEGGSKEIEYW